MGKLILNGVEYSTSGNLYYPVIYSDTERKIGVWRSNKPLYQKTVSFTITGNNNYISYSHGISDVDEIMIDMGGSYIGDYSNGFKPISAYTSSAIGFQINALCTRTSVDYRADSNIDGQIARITVRYTKTTDTAGSGNWNTDGIPKHHYSTNEQVIGTWIGGKPLYEKTINSNVTIPSNDSVDFSLSGYVSDVSDIISCSVYDATNKRTVPFFTIQTFSNYGVTVFADAINGVITFSRGSAGAITINCYITIQYTKTTD